MEKFIIIDGNSLANRAFYAMPYLTNSKKQPSGAVFGFANLLIKLICEQKPKYLAVAFDHARKTFRNNIYEDYKGGRKETPPELLSQFPVIKQMLDILGIKTFELAGIEADDIIGTLAKHSDCQNILVSGDRDLLQLIDDHSQVWLTKKGVTEIEKYDEAALLNKYGLKPAGIVDLKSLMGDASDNIPGVAGVGEKTALSLLAQYETLDGVYLNLNNIKGKLKEKLEFGKESAYMSHQLATIKTDCQIESGAKDCTFQFPLSQEAKDFFEEWGFRSLENRKDLFEEGVRSKRAELTKTELKTLEEVQSFVGKIKNQFCYDLQKLQFFIGGQEVYFISTDLNLFCQPLELSEVIEALKKVFEDDNILKITNDAKNDIKLLKKYGVAINYFFDIEIARYVLYAGLPKRELCEVYEMLEAKNELLMLMQQQQVEQIYNDVEIPLARVLADMEEEGFKVDEKELDVLAQKYNLELESLTQKIYTLAGEEFNINSPKQVAHILFDVLGLKSWNNKKQSTNVAVLEDMIWQHEIVGCILAHRKLAKLISTYVNVYQNICKTSGNVIHTIFNQTLTSTGRLSSSEPNMQNIPARREEGRVLRKIFVSKYKGGRIISADYSQIELRLLANMAHEDSMINAYMAGIDIHTKTASEIFNVPVKSVTPQQRQDAKAVNFGIIYGISDFGLSQNIKTTVNKAKTYIDSYFERYPKIKSFMDANIDFARKNGLIKSYFGRIRHIPEINASNFQVRKFGERVAMNMPLQGTASDVIKMAMIKVWKGLANMKSHLILQIHDELIVDCAADEVDKVQNLLKQAMESVCDFAVPLCVTVGIGQNLFECK